MIRILSFYLFLILGITQINTQNQIFYQHPIPYNPATYLCYKTPNPIKIDGKLTDPAWQKATPTQNFQDIQGNLKPVPPLQTFVKMLWDDDYFYFGAFLEEPHLWATQTQRDAVIFHENDFEIFIDPDGDTHNYYEFEINALNTFWDLLLLRPYREDRNRKVLNYWDIRGIKTAVHLAGTLNNPVDVDSFWTVEIAIPWKVLKEMTPKNLFPKEGVQWRINFSRVQWHLENVEGVYQKKKDENGKNLQEENWVWSPQGYINMHRPETWGFVQFSEKIVGEESVEFKQYPDDKIKWALRKLYYQQRKYFGKHKKFTDELGLLTLPKVEMEHYVFDPKLILTFRGFEIVAESLDGKSFWIIRENGLIRKVR